MATLPEIASYWAKAEETATVLPDLESHWIGWGEPFCFACGWLAPGNEGPRAWAAKSLTGWLERAHLVDRWLGGSGEPENLVPLCCLCHEDMTGVFETREAALAWVAAKGSPVGETYHPWWQFYTDCHAKPDGSVSRRSTMLRLKGTFFERMIGALDGRLPAPFGATQVAADPSRPASDGTGQH